MHNLIAIREQIIPGFFEGIGPLGLQNRAASDAPTLFNTFISNVIGILTIVAAIWFTFTLISGAISVITSGGDKNKIAEARGRIMMGLVGLVIVIVSIFLIELIGTLIGFDLILNPAEFINLYRF